MKPTRLVVLVFVFCFLLPLFSMHIQVGKAATGAQIVDVKTFDSWGNQDFFLNRGRNMTAVAYLNSQFNQTLQVYVSVEDETQVPSGFASQEFNVTEGQNILNITLLVQSYGKVGLANVTILATDTNNLPICSEFVTAVYIQEYNSTSRVQATATPQPSSSPFITPVATFCPSPTPPISPTPDLTIDTGSNPSTVFKNSSNSSQTATKETTFSNVTAPAGASPVVSSDSGAETLPELCFIQTFVGLFAVTPVVALVVRKKAKSSKVKR